MLFLLINSFQLPKTHVVVRVGSVAKGGCVGKGRRVVVGGESRRNSSCHTHHGCHDYENLKVKE